MRRSVPALFVDTSAFYAVADESDRHHDETKALFTARGVAGDLKTSDHVFVESWCLMRARLGKAVAMKYWDAMETGVVQVYGVKSDDLARARSIARTWRDQDFSLVDCTSFALIERLSIAEALALDTHFRVYRFGPRRRSALNVLP
jgi:predicted nucleic acid-binding protein